MTTNSSIDIEDKQRLEMTLNIRSRIIEEMTKKGIPSDKEDRAFLMQAVDGMDRTVLGRARIKAEDKANQSQQATAGLIASLLSKVSAHASANIENTSNKKITPTLPSEIVVTNPVPGESQIGISEENYNTFIEKFET